MILRHHVDTDTTFEWGEDVTLGDTIVAGDPICETHWGLEEMQSSVKVSDRLSEDPEDNSYINKMSLPKVRVWIRYQDGCSDLRAH